MPTITEAGATVNVTGNREMPVMVGESDLQASKYIGP